MVRPKHRATARIVASLLACAQLVAHDSATAQESDAAARAQVKLELARRYLADGIPALRGKAERLLTEAIRVDPEAIDAYGELVRLTIWEIAVGTRAPGELDRALAMARQVRDMAPERPLGYFLTCESLNAMGEKKLSMEMCAFAESRFPNHNDTLVFQARYYSERNPRLALRAAQRALEAGVSADVLSRAVGAAFASLTDLRSKGEALRNFATIFPDRWLWHHAAQSFLQELRWDDARNAYEHAIAEGNILESRLQLGVLCHKNLEDRDCAKRRFQELLELVDRMPELGDVAFAGIAVHLVQVHLALGENGPAAKLAHDALGRQVTNELLQRTLIEEFSQRKLLGLLEPALTEVAQRNPASDFTHRMLGRISLANGKTEDALMHLSRAVVLVPDDDSAYAARAHAYYVLTRYQEALGDFERAIRLRPQEAVHHYNRACMQALLGNRTEALASLRTAFTLDAKLVEVAASDEDFRSLRDDEDFRAQLRLPEAARVNEAVH